MALNNDYKVPEGKRKFKKVTDKEFEKILSDWADKNDIEYETQTPFPTLDVEDATIIKDFKYFFLASDYVDEIDSLYDFLEKDVPTTDNLLGMHTLSNGLTFYGACAIPDGIIGAIFYIAYYDGNKVRVYVPTKGNMVNTHTKAVIGQTTEIDDTKKEKLANKYLKENHLYGYKGKITSAPIDVSKVSLDLSFIAKYYDIDIDTDWDDDTGNSVYRQVDFDWEMMKEDILTHLKPL